MTYLKYFGLSVLFTLITGANAQTPDTLAGRWQGAIEIPGAPLDIDVTLQFTDAWQGSIDIPAQDAFDMPLESIVVNGEAIQFVITGIPGEPTFAGVQEGERIEGTFSQAGQTFSFQLQRVDSDAMPASMQERYEDPEDRFSTPVPSNWTVTEGEGYVQLSAPEEGMDLYLLTIDSDALEAAVVAAWERINPEFALEPTRLQDIPFEPGVERSVLISYEEDAYGAYARLYEGVTYIMLIDAEQEIVQRRAAQFNIVFTGFRIDALIADDLTDVTPLPVTKVLPELEAFIQEQLAALEIPGATVAIVQEGKLVYAEGFGVREAGGDVPMTADTQMMIGSVGKSLTTTLIAALVDDGQLDWDTRAVELLPQFAVADSELTEQITVRKLVCACSGVPRRDLELFFNANDLNPEAIVASLETFKFLTDFGEAFQYSNQLFAVGGYAAAAADGASLDDLLTGYAASLKERILSPLGMNDTTLDFDAVLARNRYAAPHQYDFESWATIPASVDLERFLLPVAPAGAHWSTAEDLARYLLMHLNTGKASDGTRVVSETNLGITWEPQIPVTATTQYGLGWFVEDYKSLTLYHHSGNTLGFTAEVAFLPDAGLGIVVLTNAQWSGLFTQAVRTRLLELMFEQPSQIEETIAFFLADAQEELTQWQESIRESVDLEAVTPFLGSYVNAALGEITLSLEAGRLILDAGSFETELRPVVDEDGEVMHYLNAGDPMPSLVSFKLQTDETGEHQIQLGQGVQGYTFTRLE